LNFLGKIIKKMQFRFCRCKCSGKYAKRKKQIGENYKLLTKSLHLSKYFDIRTIQHVWNTWDGLRVETSRLARKHGNMFEYEQREQARKKSTSTLREHDKTVYNYEDRKQKTHSLHSKGRKNKQKKPKKGDKVV